MSVWRRPASTRIARSNDSKACCCFLLARIGNELRLYAEARQILEPLTERNRCWRLDYANEVKFHIDNLPCVPEDSTTVAALIQAGIDPSFASLAIALTCKAHPQFGSICSDWPTSNPAAFAIWFERRFMAIAQTRKRVLLAEGVYKSVEKIPVYALKTPLQRGIQLLKRHRDVMFQDEQDLKPISMILTTLAALAYEGEEDLHDALAGILERIPNHVRTAFPKIPNPVNPGEDFADKWRKNPALEESFWNWHIKATQDFESLGAASDSSKLQKLSERTLAIKASEAQRVPTAFAEFPDSGPGFVISSPTRVCRATPIPFLSCRFGHKWLHSARVHVERPAEI